MMRWQHVLVWSEHIDEVGVFLLRLRYTTYIIAMPRSARALSVCSVSQEGQDSEP
jgi:hypothetical protein